MRTIICFFIFFVALNSNAQNKFIPPIYNQGDNYDLLIKKIAPCLWPVLADSSVKQYSKFVLVSFEIAENDKVENIKFSKDFPERSIESIRKIIMSTNSDWISASVEGIKIRKRIVLPIIFQKGNSIDKNFEMDQISENLNFSDFKFNDAIFLPIFNFYIQQ